MVHIQKVTAKGSWKLVLILNKEKSWKEKEQRAVLA